MIRSRSSSPVLGSYASHPERSRSRRVGARARTLKLRGTVKLLRFQQGALVAVENHQRGISDRRCGRGVEELVGELEVIGLGRWRRFGQEDGTTLVVHRGGRDVPGKIGEPGDWGGFAKNADLPKLLLLPVEEEQGFAGEAGEIFGQRREGENAIRRADLFEGLDSASRRVEVH